MIRVLVADDEPAALDIACRYVQAVDGFAVVGRARDGREAAELIRSLAPDLVILDIDMPFKNGLELLEELRREDNAARVLFLTAAGDPASLARAEALGIVDYLVKPVGLERFRQALRKCEAVF